MPPTTSPTNTILTALAPPAGDRPVEPSTTVGARPAAASRSAILWRWREVNERRLRESPRGSAGERGRALRGSRARTAPGGRSPLGPARASADQHPGAVGGGESRGESARDLHRGDGHRADPQSGRVVHPAPRTTPGTGGSDRVPGILPDADGDRRAARQPYLQPGRLVRPRRAPPRQAGQQDVGGTAELAQPRRTARALHRPG